MTLQEKCDFLVDNLDADQIIGLLSSLGADRYEDKGEYIVFPTICHNESSEDASMKLYYYKDNHFFFCYTECGGMSIFNFLKHYYETRGISYDWYEDVFCVVEHCSVSQIFETQETIHFEKKKDKYKKREVNELPEFNKGVLDVFTKYYPIEWLNDGISKEAMDKFNILYSISQNKIIIPHYDVSGRLVGIRGRALNEWEVELGAKYMPIELEGKWFKHKLSLNLYGLYENKENIKETGICYLFESEKSVLQLENFDMPNCGLAVCGSSFNILQLKILMKECHPKEIVICFDKEEKEGESKYLEKLIGLCSKYKNYCNFSFVYDRDNLLDMKDSPSDRGQEVFKQLLEKRRKIK